MHKEYHEFIQRLMRCSNAQLALLMGLFLLLILACGYWLVLTAIVQSAAAVERQLSALDEQIVLQQRALLRQPPRAEWQAALDAILPPQAVLQPLPQRLLAPLNAVSGRLLHWLPDSQAIGDVGPLADLQQRGTFTLRLPYSGLVRLLEGLMTQSPVPLTIERLSLTRPAPGLVTTGTVEKGTVTTKSVATEAETLLDVTLELASYRGAVTAQQRRRAQALFATRLGRDPFVGAVPVEAHCDDAAQGPELAQLRGVLGDARGYTGWLRLETGDWLRAKAGETLAGGLGHVDEVSQQKIRVSYDRPRCGIKQQTFTLPGS